MCDDGNNVAECDFDGGDCCTPSAPTDVTCTICECIGGEGYEGNFHNLLVYYLSLCLLKVSVKNIFISVTVVSRLLHILST